MTMHLSAKLKRLQNAKRTYDRALKGMGPGLRKDVVKWIASALPSSVDVEWSPGSPPVIIGCRGVAWCIDELYHAQVPGLTKNAARAFLQKWKALPEVVLDKAFGVGATVRVGFDGAYEITE